MSQVGPAGEAEELGQDVEQQGAEEDEQVEARGGGQEGELQEDQLPHQDGRQQEPEAVLDNLLKQFVVRRHHQHQSIIA